MSVDVAEQNRFRRLLAQLPGADQLPDAFRLPTEADPAPANRQIAAVCGWAAALGLGGMAVALRAFVGLIAANRGWYAPTVITVGVIGLICTIAAFASVHRRRLPFALLGVATFMLAVDWIITGF